MTVPVKLKLIILRKITQLTGTCSDFYLLVKGGLVRNYGRTPILQALTPVPVTEPGTSPGTGSR